LDKIQCADEHGGQSFEKFVFGWALASICANTSKDNTAQTQASTRFVNGQYGANTSKHKVC